MEETGGYWLGCIWEDTQVPNSAKETDCQDGGSGGQGESHQGEGETIHGVEKHTGQAARTGGALTVAALQADY